MESGLAWVIVTICEAVVCPAGVVRGKDLGAIVAFTNVHSEICVMGLWAPDIFAG